MFKYFVSYIALIILWVCFIISILRIFEVINIQGSLLIPILISGWLYHEYKPMPFNELLNKYLGIKFPSISCINWKNIKSKFFISLGVDKDTLDKEK
jgi:hypothetical protein